MNPENTPGQEATTDASFESSVSPHPEIVYPEYSDNDGSGGKTLKTILVSPNSFNRNSHWYEKALNAQINPMVRFFCNLTIQQIVTRYCHMNPQVKAEGLHSWLLAAPKYFAWSGADLFHVATPHGKRQMVLIEVNSCPSGQKSMPALVDDEDQGGYRSLMEDSFLPRLNRKRSLSGHLAILYDKNYTEVSGYAAALADAAQEKVFLVPMFRDSWQDFARYVDRHLQVKCPETNEWVPVRGAFRYVTQQPWDRFPVDCKTFIFNPITACIAGGRNKLLAAKAYDFFNGELAQDGLKIQTPFTIWDVSKEEVRLWVARLGGRAVIKIPYSNAGQGVFTITSPAELDAFMERTFRYERFIVQRLIGNIGWSSSMGSNLPGQEGILYHIGTVPTRNNETFAADLRMMVHHTANGWRPLALYARRAIAPLSDSLSETTDSWAMLGTNLSSRAEDGSWKLDTSRLILFDRKDFNMLGLGIDDLISGFVQTVLATLAIDALGNRLVSEKGTLRSRLLQSLNDDPSFISEIL